VRLAVVISLVAALLPAGAIASARPAAHVAVASLSPVSIRGTSFRAHERVRLTVFAKTTRTKTVTAGARGGFTATFKALSVTACEGYSVRAKGNHGSVAFLKVMTECPPPAASG
jgi:hypothetical protein